MPAPSSTTHPSARILALDTLRFLAAIVVVLEHANVVWPFWGRAPFALAGVLNAHSAVAFFFVLSGYVLHLSWKGQALRWHPFLAFSIKRVLRLYPLFYLSIVIGGLALIFLPLQDVPALLGNEYTTNTIVHKNHLDGKQWLLHAALIAPGLDNEFINPPMWTLSAEMRISLIFPVLSFALMTGGIRRALLLTALLFAVGPWLAEHILPTFGIVALFALGIGLAIFGQQYQGSGRMGALLLICGLLTYSSATWIGRATLGRWGEPYVAGLGAAMIMLAALWNQPLARALSHPWLAALGQCSYGVYVLHFPIILIMAWVVHQMGGGAVMFILGVFGITLAASLVLYRWLEEPFIKLGRKLAKRVTNRSVTPKPHP